MLVFLPGSFSAQQLDVGSTAFPKFESYQATCRVGKIASRCDRAGAARDGDFAHAVKLRGRTAWALRPRNVYVPAPSSGRNAHPTRCDRFHGNDLLTLEPVSGFENPPHGGEAYRQEYHGHCQAYADIDVG